MLIDPTALLSLSKNAIFVVLHLYGADMLSFTMRELSVLLSGKNCSNHILYAVIQELEAHQLVTHVKPAPGRPSTYHLALFEKSLSSSICLSDFKTNVSERKALANISQKPVTLSENDQTAVASLARQYGLQGEFLFEKIQERGKTFDLLELQKTLAVSKQKSTKDFAGYFFTAYVKRGLFSPYIAHESGYRPPTRTVHPQPKPKTPAPTPPAADWQAYIEQRVDYTYFKTWVLPCTAMQADGVVTIIAPSDVHVDHLNELYLPLLSEAFGVAPDALRVVVRPPVVGPLPEMVRPAVMPAASTTKTADTQRLSALVRRVVARA